MNTELKDALMNASSLLTKAAAALECAHTLEKEASATAEDVISHGMASNDQREFYKDFFVQHPEKIATIKNAFKELPIVSGLGEASVVSTAGRSDALDDFDRALLS